MYRLECTAVHVLPRMYCRKCTATHDRQVGSIVVKELEHAKNVKYWLSWDGAFVLVWCIDSVPFPNLVGSGR